MNRNTALLFVCTALSTMQACKKTETPPEVITVVNTPLTNGVPTYKKQNGYFYSALSTSKYANQSSSFSSQLQAMASFNDPEKNMLTTFNHYNVNNFGNPFFGNVDVGNITLNNLSISKFLSSSEVSYSRVNNTNTLNYSAAWTTAGNKTFVPLNVTLPRGYPVINTTALNIPTNLYKSTGYILNLNNNITNYDSLIVILNGQNFNSIRKIIINNEQSVIFTSQELSQLTNYNVDLKIYSFNYSSQTINNKKMVFELSNQLSIYQIQLNN